MKIWFETCNLNGYFEDSDVKLGVGWYRHSKNHKWKGFSINFYLYQWIVVMNFVDNYVEYDKIINYRKYKKLES